MTIKERKKESNRKYRAAHPEKIRDLQRKRYAAHPGKVLEDRRKRRYGKGSHEHLEAQVKKQHGCCAICAKPFTETPCLDHNHETKQWRGALCQGCNIALGYFGEDTGTLRKAVWYLQQWRTNA